MEENGCFEFGEGRLRPTRRAVQKIAEIARRFEGVEFREETRDGAYRCWFVGPRSDPRQEARLWREVWRALGVAGLVDEAGALRGGRLGNGKVQ